MTNDALVPQLPAREVYGRLLGYAKPYWRMFAVSILGMLIYAATEPVFAAMMKPLIDGSFVPPAERLGRVLHEGETLAIWPPVAGG